MEEMTAGLKYLSCQVCFPTLQRASKKTLFVYKGTELNSSYLMSGLEVRCIKG